MDVTRVREQRHGHKVHNTGRDRRTFSNTADRTHVANTGSGLPKRGGIRL